MDTYIATFFSHFGAIHFRRSLLARNVPCQLMPVPRAVSSSCGTCVQFEAEDPERFTDAEEVEALFRRTDLGFEKLLSNL